MSEDDETSLAERGLGGMDSAVAGAGERLLRAWRERLASDGSAGGVAGATEAALVRELAAGLLYPVDAPKSMSARSLKLARTLGERAHGMDTATLHARFAHLRGALFADLLDNAVPSLPEEEGRRIGLCLDRAEELVGPLAAAAFDGCCESASVDPQHRRTDRAERLVQRLRHDIKTPLQAASLNLELLALERAESEDDVEAIATIQASIDQAVDMLRPLDEPVGEH